jgi:hypothetical protein
MIMEIPEVRVRIYEHVEADREVATHELDVGCEFRTVSAAAMVQFVPGRDREREEMRFLQECRHRRVRLHENRNCTTVECE